VVRFQAVVKIRRSLINRLEKICLDICTCTMRGYVIICSYCYISVIKG